MYECYISGANYWGNPQTTFYNHGGNGRPVVNGTKDSFLRGLREVAPEIELFLENHGHFTKKLYLKEYV